MKKLSTLLVALVMAATVTFCAGCGIGNDTASEGEAGASEANASAQTEETYNPDIDYDLDHTFKNKYKREDHYERHGEEMGYDSPEEYEWAADQVIHNEEALHKLEKEDGDDVYYVEDTNEFVIVSQRGYIRTYFEPDRGIKYYYAQ